MSISNATEIIMESGNMIAESINNANAIAISNPGSVEQASAIFGTAGIVAGLVGKIDSPFTQSLATGLGVNIGAIGVVTCPP